MFVIAVDRQAAGAVDREIVPAEHCRVQRGVAVGEGVIRAVGDRVDRALRRGEKDLVRAADIDRGAVFVGNGRVFQHELDLVLLADLDHDHALVFAGEDVGAGFCDRQIVGRGERKGFGGVVLARSVAFGHRGIRRGSRQRGGQHRPRRGGGRAFRRACGSGPAAGQHKERKRADKRDLQRLFHNSSPPSLSFRMAISRFPFRQRRASSNSCSLSGSFISIL